MRRAGFVALFFTVGCLPSLVLPELAAQAVASAPAVPSPVVVMSPFEVNTDRDTGYQAASSVAGGRIDTAVDRTPAALSILTREFLDDVAANGFLDAALWSPNSMAVPVSRESNESRLDFRGTNSNSTPTVNYFTFALPLDTFSMERIEFARGPNSILFGQGTLSGIATVNLKQARWRNFGEVQLRFDDFETRRATLDVNRTLAGGRAALRFDALVQDGQRWRKPNPDDRRGYLLAGTARIAARTTLRFEGEYGKGQQTWAEGIFPDNASNWNGAGFDAASLAPPPSAPGTPPPPSGGGGGPPPPPGNGTPPPSAAQGVTVFPSSADYLVFFPARPERGVLNYRGLARTTGMQNFALVPGGRPYIPNFPDLPYYGFDFQPANNLQETEHHFATLYLEQQFGEDTFVQLAINDRDIGRRRSGTSWSSGLRRDPNTFLPNREPNPDFARFYVDGEPIYQRDTDASRDYRLLATHRLENAWMEHRFSGYLSGQRTRGRTYSERFVRTDNAANPSPTSGSNFIQQRYYLDDAVVPFAFDPAAFRGLAVHRYRFNQTDTGTNGRTAQLAAVSAYGHGKFNTIAGYRRDDTDRHAINSTADARTGELSFKRVDSGEDIGTASAGAVWYPIRMLGAFFNYSESFSGAAVGETLLNSKQPPGVPRGRTREYGVYFKLAGDRVQGSLRHYDSFEGGRIVNATAVPSINAIWQALGQTQNVETGMPRDTQALASTGWELEGTARFTPGWRTMFNVALPRSRQSRSFPETIAYRARYLAQWQAAAPANTTVETALQAIDAVIVAGADRREQNTQPDYRANFYSAYDFRTGPLRGFGFGGGANIFGRQLIGNVADRPFDYIYTPGYTIVSAHVAYAARWRHVGWKVQLNVTNLFDEHVLRFTNVAHYTPASGRSGPEGDYPANFRYIDPRKCTLTTTFTF